MGAGHSVLNQGVMGRGYRAGQRAGLPSYADMAEMLGIDTNSGAFGAGVTTAEVSRETVETVVTTIFPVGRVIGGGSSAISRMQEFAMEHTGDTCNSFVRGTRVLLADGSHTAIEVLQIGDQVWASDRFYRPTTTEVLVPSSEPGLSGRYRFMTQYNLDGTVRAQTMHTRSNDSK